MVSQEKFDVEGMPTSAILFSVTHINACLDPGTGQVFATCLINKAADVDAPFRTSHEAFQHYSQVNPRQRAKWLLKWHDINTSAHEDMANLLVYETRKPLVEARGEVGYALSFAWRFAGGAERIRDSIAIASVSERRTFIIKQPIGVGVALVSWSLPVAMFICKVAIVLAAGCTMIVRLRRVTFTGSTNISKRIAEHCSVGLEKVTMELNRDCPFIMLNNGDLDKAVAGLMILEWRIAGQACTHANRVSLHNPVYDRFARLMVEATRNLREDHDRDFSLL